MKIKILFLAAFAVCLSVLSADVNPSDNILRYSSITSPAGVLVGDWNNDGVTDYGYSAGGVVRFDYSADESIDKSLTADGASLPSLFSKDMNGDSIPDVVFVDDAGSIYQLDGQTGNWGTIAPGFGTSVTLSLSALQIAAGNIDGSGNLDLVVLSSGNLAVFYNFADKGASLSIADADFSQALTVGGAELAVGDMNDDGRDDIVYSESNIIYGLDATNLAGGNFFTVGLPATPGDISMTSTGTRSLAIGDPNNDSVYVLGGTSGLSGHMDSSELSVITGASGHSFGATVEYSDVNGDTIEDLSVMSASVGNAGNVVILDASALPQPGNSASVDTLTVMEVFTGDASDQLGLFHTIVENDSTGEHYLFASLDDAFVVLPTGLYDKMGQTIQGTTSVISKTFGDAPFEIPGYATSGLDLTLTSGNAEISLSGNVATINGAGNVSVALNQSGNALYEATLEEIITIEIAKASQTISFSAIDDKAVNDADFSLTVSSDSGEAVSVSSNNTGTATVSGTTVSLSGAEGFVTMTASVPASANYLAATDVEQSFTVSKVAQSITSSNFTTSRTEIVSNDFILNCFSSAGLTLSFDSSDTSVATISLFDAGQGAYLIEPLVPGTTSITFSQAGDGTYAAATSLVMTLTVTDKLVPEVTFSSIATVTYGDTLLDDFGASSNISGTMSYDYSSANVLDAGVYTVTATFTPTDTATYSANTAMATLTVEKAVLTVTATDATKTYNTSNPSLTATYSGFKNGQSSSDLDTEATVSSNATTVSDVGTYTLTPSGAASDNYSFTYVAGELTITKADSTISSETLPALVIGDTLDLSAYFGNSDGLILSYSSENDSIASISSSTLTAVAGGTINVTGSAAGNANFNAPTDVTLSLTISKKANSITNNSATTASFGSTYSPSASATSGETVSFSSSDQSVLTDAGVTASSGNTTITLSAAGTDEYGAATDVTFVLTVTNDAPVVSMDTTASSANVGSSITVQGSISDSDTTGISWTLLADGISVATGTGAVVSTTYTSGFAGDVSLVLRGNDGDKSVDSTAVTVSFIAVESNVSDNVLSDVDSSVSNLGTGTSQTDVESSLTTLFANNSGADVAKSLVALSTTAVSGVQKVFTAGNVEVTVEKFAVAGNATSGNLTLENNEAGSTVTLATNLDEEFTDTLPTGAVAGSTFSIDFIDANGDEVTSGFTRNILLAGVVDPTSDGTYKLYRADDSTAVFSDSGFNAVVVNGTDLYVTMTQFSTYTVVEEETATPGLSGGSGGGGCLLK